MTDMTIVIGADLAPIETDGKLFAEGKTALVVDPALLKHLQECDCSIFNLEGPLLNTGMPIRKDGPHISVREDSVNGFAALHIGLLTLANNHIMDYGEGGLCRTREILEQQGIPYIGAGNTIDEAKAPYIVEQAGRRVGVYACADREFSIASETLPGANPFTMPDSLNQIRTLKEQCDYVIVLYHGGRELYRYPSPGLQQICRQMADAGADIVVCQHSHCMGSEEEYHGARILYGQGNFIFGDAEDDVCVHSILMKIEIRETLHITYLPFRREKGRIVVMPSHEERRVMEEFEKRSMQIRKPGFIKEKYRELAETAIAGYLYQLAGWPLLLIRIDKLFGRRLIKKSFRKKEKRLLYVLNMFQCDAHRELIEQGLKNLL